MAAEEVILRQKPHAYPYQPLSERDSIRLLLLHPKSSGQTVECSLIHTRLSHAETDVIDHYTALSYVWGDPSKTEVILVDSSHVTITANLHDALLNIRDSSRIIRLWVDAICINQYNNGEKSVQVGMMSKIYSTAHHTIIYLGSIEPHIASALTFGELMPQLALEYILSKEWFTRVWVFQELVLSKDPWLQLAGHRWKWDYVHACLQKKAVGTSSTNIPGKDWNPFDEAGGITRFSQMDLARQNYQSRSPKRQNLFDLLKARRGLQATDPRDMIYALLSLASNADAISDADYTKKCCRVFEECAVQQLLRYKDCRILFQVGDPYSPKRMKNLPTWVPDWSQSIPPQAHYVRPGSEGDPPVEAENLVSGSGFSFLPSILTLVGSKCDSVMQTSEPLGKYDEKLSECFSGMDTFVDGYFRSEGNHGHKDNMLYGDVIKAWSDIIGEEILPPGSFLYSSTDKTISDLMYRFRHDDDYSDASFRDVIKGRAIEDIMEIIDGLDCSDTLVASLLPGVGKIIRERLLAVLSRGRLLVVPPQVRIGDFISSTCLEEYTQQNAEDDEDDEEEVHLLAEPFILRPNLELGVDADDASILAKASGSLNQRGVADCDSVPVLHCTFVCLLSMRYYQSLSEYESPFDGDAVFAIH